MWFGEADGQGMWAGLGPVGRGQPSRSWSRRLEVLVLFACVVKGYLEMEAVWPLSLRGY